VEFQGWYPLFELEDELFSKEERDVMVDWPTTEGDATVSGQEVRCLIQLQRQDIVWIGIGFGLGFLAVYYWNFS
jgi:hypothetical protein